MNGSLGVRTSSKRNPKKIKRKKNVTHARLPSMPVVTIEVARPGQPVAEFGVRAHIALPDRVQTFPGDVGADADRVANGGLQRADSRGRRRPWVRRKDMNDVRCGQSPGEAWQACRDELIEE